MDSFAFSYELNKDFKELKEDELPSATMNFNLWTFCDFEPDQFKLDIGFKIKNISNIKNMCFYVPFKVDEEDIVDLGEALSENNKVLCAIFNEAYSVQRIANSKLVKIVKPKSSNAEFYIYALDTAENIAIEYYKVNKGTFLYINVDKIKSSFKNMGNDFNTCYFRFRIQSEELKRIVRDYPVKNRFFETKVYSTYLIDFRLNNMRSMDESLIEKMSNELDFMNMDSVHFLLMTRADVDVDTNSFTKAGRVLEDGIWEKYIYLNGSKVKNLKDIIAYHAAQKKDENKYIESWEFFTKMKVGKCSKKTIGAFIGVTAVIGVCVNIISNILWMFLQKIF